MIPTFNDGAYLQKCIQSVIEASPSQKGLEIVVIDDGSTRGDPRQVVSSFGVGRIKLIRNKNNLGSTGNFNRCIEESRGELVHILHADDWVEKEFYASVDDAFLRNPEAAMVCCRVYIVDDEGELLELSPRLDFLNKPSLAQNQLYRENLIRTPRVVVKKSVYKKIGGFDPSLRHAADWELWIRILREYRGLFINRPLANYRFFANNETHRFYKTGENIQDLMRLYFILLKRDLEFSGKDFLDEVYQLTRNQIKKYHQLGESEAVAANQSALCELLPHLDLKRKLQSLILLIRTIL
jgi:glycosyltransferase involved in cell wall biosynthesis